MSYLYNGTSFIHLNFQILCTCIQISFWLIFAAVLLSISRPLRPMECFLCFHCLLKSFMFHSRIFSHSKGDVTITSKGLQILTYTRHLYTLSSKNSLAYYTNCGKGHWCIMAISSVSRDTHTCCRAFSSGTVTKRIY